MDIQQIHNLTVQEVYTTMETSSRGLSGQEAEKRLTWFGQNVTAKKKEKPLIISFLSNFTHLMALLLWAAGIIGFLAQLPQLAIAIWMVNIINGVFSFWQEFRAGKATMALDNMLPSYARVLRDGGEQKLETRFLVPGDVILLGEGDIVPADCRLVESSDLNVDQSAFTGESVPIHKVKDSEHRDDLSLIEQPNLVFMGSAVTSGTAQAVVMRTGMGTQFGKIASAAQNVVETPSPLQMEMGKITRTVSLMALLVSGIFFLLSILVVDTPLAAAFIFALGMIVAFIPEGLLPTVTLSLAMAVQRMAKKHALIKRLSSVETLGCATVICTDKTGTLTQNEMTVTDIWIPEAQYRVTGTGYDHMGGQVLTAAKQQDQSPELERLLVTAGLCTNARLLPPDKEVLRWTVLGDPTEAALLVAAKKAGLDLELEAFQNPRLRELPFDSRRKRMSTVHKTDTDDFRLVCVKGAPREVLSLCTRKRTASGEEQDIDDTFRKRVMDANDAYAREGLRVLAVAERLLDKLQGNLPRALGDYTPEAIEKDLVFLGLIAMADPPREEVAQAVEHCYQAGIRIIMITGDYGLTAQSIARRIGIVRKKNPRIVTGAELETLDDDGLKTILKDEVIFARVAPEQKLHIVSTLQNMGEVVAVTGDGVNDAPALKKAHIGVAMGIGGTDVAKEASDMILTDDNFASIVGAIEEGRSVYENIRKFITYIFSSNMSEAIPTIIHLFSGGLIPLPLTVMQVLAVDLGTDMVPAMGLGVEKSDQSLMLRPPRSLKEPLLNRAVLIRSFLWYGLLEAIFCMGGYFLFNLLHGWPGTPLPSTGTAYAMSTTMTFAAIVMGQIGIVHACRKEQESVRFHDLTGNRLILIGIVVELLVLLCLMYVPFLQKVFNTAPLGAMEWLYLVAIPPAILVCDHIRKKIMYPRTHRKTTAVKSYRGA